jgi:predicted Zn-dependent peptidase
MRKIAWLLAFSLLCSLTLTAGSKIEFKEFTLDNGLHVILHQDNTTPIVTVSVMYHVGSKNEDPERTGFAHFFEHLLFEGTKNIPRGEFDRYIDKAGGANNAYTIFDRTFYFTTLPSNHLEMGLWLESERLLHAKVEEIGVETQREVVKEERRQRVDNQPYGTVIEEILKRAYTVHPYRWPVIGSLEHLNAATIEEFRQFYKDFYVPQNAILSIAGDIDVKDAKKMVKKYFDDIPAGEGEVYRPTIVEPPLESEVRDVVYDNVQLPAVVMAYRSPAYGTEDFYPMRVLSNLLSVGGSSRLQRFVVDEKQKAVFAGTFPLEMEDPGLSLMFGVANGGVAAEDLESAIQVEIEKVKTELVGEKEFSKLMAQIETDLVSRNMTVGEIAENLAYYHQIFGDAGMINKEIDKYRKVTPEDLMRVANKYLKNDNRVVLYYLPKSMAEGDTNG